MIEPSRVIWASSLPSFINYPTQSFDILISGNLPNNATTNFLHTFSLPSGTNFVDVYFTNNLTGHKMLMNICGVPGTIVYSAAGFEQTSTYIQYPSVGTLTAGLAINNLSGGNITATTQTLSVEAVVYKVPF